MNEREISIVDLMVEILLHWRMFIIWMIAGAVVLGAFSYVRSGNAVKQQQVQTEEAEQAPEEWLTEEEMQNVEYVVSYEKMYLAKEAYREKSPLMQADFNNISKAEATIAIVAAQRQQSCDIERVYEDIVKSSECIVKVAEDTDMETVGVAEMLYLDREAESVAIESGEGAGTFKIVAVHNDEGKCKDMLESAVSFLKEKQPAVGSALGEHEIIVVNESFGVVSDMDIADLQKAVLNDIAAMKKTVSDAKDALSDVEKRYYDLLMSDVVEEAEEAVSSPTAAPAQGISKKYVLLGAVLAAFVYAFILLLVYIFNTKIRATDSLLELYGLPQLGVVPKEAGKKRVLGVVDKWIMSIRDHNKRQFSPDEALELAAVAAKMAAGKEALQEICLMGCGLKEQSLDVCEKMKKRLEEEKIQVNILNNVLYDAQMMEELEKAKGVVLVESADSTLYNEIAEELELLKRQDIKVLGGVLVG